MDQGTSENGSPNGAVTPAPVDLAHEVQHIFHLRKAITAMRNRDRSEFQQRMYDALRNVQDMLESDLHQRGVDVDVALGHISMTLRVVQHTAAIPDRESIKSNAEVR